MNKKRGNIPIASWLKKAKQQLITKDTNEPLSSLYAIISDVLHLPKEFLLANPRHVISNTLIDDLDRKLKDLISGRPLAYILGKWDFYGLEFKVNENVLIPRPETELLVENALKWLKSHPDKQEIADVGTGSGCIAVSIALYSSTTHILASDSAFSALQVARCNRQKYGLENRIELVCTDLLRPIEHQFDLICANLPYIPQEKLLDLMVYQLEPKIALNGGVDGLRIIKPLILDLPRIIKPGGIVLIEIEAIIGKAAADLCQKKIPYSDVQILKDLADKERLLRITFP